MSAPESIFLSTGIQGTTQNTSAESPDNKANEANAALFVSIMEQYAPPSSSKMESWSARSHVNTPVGGTDDGAATGKTLPAMPEGLPFGMNLVPANAARVMPRVPDAALEEFAVDLGIDRSLARLLLRETAASNPDVDADFAPQGMPLAGATSINAADELSKQSSAQSGSSESLAAMANPAQTHLGALSERPRASVASLMAMRETALGQRPTSSPSGSMTAAASAAIPAGAVDPQPLMGSGESPLADEDVLRWRAASARGAASVLHSGTTSMAATADGMRSEAAFKPLALDALSAAATTTSVTTAATMSTAAASSAAAKLAASSPVSTARSASTNVAILPSVALVSKDSLMPDPLDSLADSVVPSQAGLEMGGLTSDTWLALSANGMRRSSASSQGLTDSAGYTAVAAAAGVTAATGLAVGVMPSIDPAAAQARPIPLPSTALDYETRAEQFAEQVGQRLIQQMRADRWTVSLQLDPRNLGPVDIALQIDGSDVRANLAVLNADVRALLEAGMPRLRDTLELAGYQLSGWSMADSGGREAATQQFAQGQVTRSPRSVDDPASQAAAVDLQASRIGGDDTGRGIDLYV